MVPEQLMLAFRDTLLSGRYNLLLGSGVSLDSRNSRNELLRSSEELRRDLCTLTGANERTSLSRAYALCTESQIKSELVDRFSNCTPGPSVAHLARFLWHRLFTFNIDDVVEKVYEGSNAKQKLIPLNFDAPFEPTPDKGELQAIHLHGWVRRRDSGFVFSTSEYIRVMTSLNPWMHLLSEILATEPFIIAGTSLNEVDLEYYLSHRSQATPRRGRGPSLLIETNPDVATRADCERYGLTLIHGTFAEFMDWLRAQFPTPPTVFDLVVPDATAIFSEQPSPKQLVRFFSDFELVQATDQPLPSLPSPFLYGREPEWNDIYQHVDVERRDNTVLAELVSQGFVSGTDSPARVVTVLDDAGTGKTTTIRRVAHDQARAARIVLNVKTLSRIDVEAARECLSRVAVQVLLLVDGFADHIEQIAELLIDDVVSSRVVVLAGERYYRKQYLDVVLGESRRRDLRLDFLRPSECQELIERYREYGLIGVRDALKNPREFARRIDRDPVAIAICRILNDFRPLDSIVQSLLAATAPEHRLPYLCVCLAQHCYMEGIRYSILQAILGPRQPIGAMFAVDAPLRVAANATDDDFVVALNPTIGEQILKRAVSEAPTALAAAFEAVASAIAPHVNRSAIMQRSPEARLAGRLFDADKIVKPLLGNRAQSFYVGMQKKWEWNSRYWEQRSLLEADDDLETALRYARHAVAIEQHPFPLTTLGKILLKIMEVDAASRDRVFAEAFENLSNAIHLGTLRSRITVHPYTFLTAGLVRYLELGGQPTIDQRHKLCELVEDARARFGNDAVILAQLQKLNDMWPDMFSSRRTRGRG